MTQPDLTLQYYNDNASAFSEGTVDVAFSELQERFLSYLKPGTRILDLGCGSGRDSKAFLAKGFQVVAVDGSEELCRLASAHIGQEVICATFQDYEPDGLFDGIWACASLLHLKYDEIAPVIARMAAHLAPGGCFYASFKYGDFKGLRNGRYFTDMTEERFACILKQLPGLTLAEQFVTEDVRPGRVEKWLNGWMRKEFDNDII